jgi:RNA-splicing ligase RtcB
LTATLKRWRRNRRGYERQEKGKKKRRGKDMVVAEEVDGAVEEVGKVGRVTEEVEVEVTGIRCCNIYIALHIRDSASA